MTDKIPEALAVLDEIESFMANSYPHYDSAEKIRKARAAFAAEHEALRTAIRQNSHDMLMTGDELRECGKAAAAVEKLP